VDDFELKEINLELEQGKILALLGPSGSGKSTLIQAISGLITVQAGKILVNNSDITSTPVHKRKIGVVFQDFALFPHLNVYHNVAFGLKSQQLSRKAIRDRVHQLLELVGLENFSQREVNSLSGGEKQRIALARTLAPKPDIILFDEPLSAVDEELRIRLREQLANIQKELGFTTIYVTHDREEAFYFADLIGIIFNGRIWQIDRPENVYEKPVSPIVARFLGIENRLSGEVIEPFQEGYMVNYADYQIYIKSKVTLNIGDQIDILLKPEKAILTRQQVKVNSFPVKLISSKNYGNKAEYLVDFAGNSIKVLQSESELLLPPSNELYLTLKAEHLLVYKDNVLLQ